uniref:CCHC-type domain-containing protein n=1 Tax=Chlamydomonas euryale TaxID=1486919 RepID=A0A7R9VAH0_9CHLO|mmetsp:Transcript_28970/g.85751  ORF Transcript_28970/g.85751 Transcript_28970/m.85751 type:complete len:431 (+) Transcript_28970:2-1294(+)
MSADPEIAFFLAQQERKRWTASQAAVQAATPPTETPDAAMTSAPENVTTIESVLAEILARQRHAENQEALARHRAAEERAALMAELADMRERLSMAMASPPRYPAASPQQQASPVSYQLPPAPAEQGVPPMKQAPPPGYQYQAPPPYYPQYVPSPAVVPVDVKQFTLTSDPVAWLDQAELAATAARAQTGQPWDPNSSYLTDIVANKILPSKVKWYRSLVTQYGSLGWNFFREQFLKEHLKVLPEWQNDHDLRHLVETTPGSKTSVAAYTDKFRSFVSHRDDAQTSPDVKKMYVFGLPVKKIQVDLLNALYKNKPDGATLDSLMSAANVSTFIHSSVKVFQDKTAAPKGLSDPMELGAAAMQSQQRGQPPAQKTQWRQQSDRPKTNFDLSGVPEVLRKQRKAAGQCLACGSKEHFLRDCKEAKPKKQGKE